MTNKDDKKLFSVVHFLSPFKGIDEYVCVPSSWIVSRPFDRRVIVSYPNDENPGQTKDRVRQENVPNKDWKMYIADIKHDTETYEEAENWIATRGRKLNEEVSKTKDTQPEPVLSRKLRSACQPFGSDPNSKKPPPTVADIVSKSTSMLPECSKQDSSLIIKDNQIGQAKTISTINTEPNTDPSSQPGIIKENQSVYTSSRHYISSILSSKEQPLSKSKRGRPPKRCSEQQRSSKAQDCQRQLSMSIANMNEPDQDTERYKKAQHEFVKKQLLSSIRATQTILNTLEQTPNPKNEGTSPLLRHEHSLPEPHQREVSAGQLEAPKSKYIQPYEHVKLPLLHVDSTLCSNPQPQGLQRKRPVEATYNHQRPRLQGFNNNRMPVSHHELSRERLPSQSIYSEYRNSHGAMKKFEHSVSGEATLENTITKNTPMPYPSNFTTQFSSIPHLPAQNHLQQAQFKGSLVNNERFNIGEKIGHRVSLPQNTINTSAAQDLTKLAQYIPTDLQQIEHMQTRLPMPTMTQSIDQRLYLPNRGGFSAQIQVNQYSQLLLHNGNQEPCIASTSIDQSLGLLPRTYHIPTSREVTLRTRPFATPTIQSQAHLNAKSSYVFQNLDIQKRQNQSHTEYHNRDLPVVSEYRTVTQTQTQTVESKPTTQDSEAQTVEWTSTTQDSETQTVESKPTTQDSETQTVESFYRPQATQSALEYSRNVYLNLRTKKYVVDQATETDSMMNVNHCLDKVAVPTVSESISKVVDSASHTDEGLTEGQRFMYKETISDTDIAIATDTDSECEIESDYEVIPETFRKTSKTVHNAPENQKTQPRRIAEQDIMQVFGTFLSEIENNLSISYDMLNCLQNSTIIGGQAYQTVLDKLASTAASKRI
ncbi:uncharacterized protein [Epargyreus clarus]